MRSIVIIPARMAASRFPGKPLAKLLGVPMVGHCYYRAMLAKGVDDVFVATCNQEIADYIKSIGGKSVLTSDTHTRATSRTAEALETIEREQKRKYQLIVMFQGDEPLIQPETITAVLSSFTDSKVKIANIMSKFWTYDDFLDKNNVKVVVDINKNAMYFSREPIPSSWKGWDQNSCFMQTGIIAFRRDALLNFNQMTESNLEKIESIDMNRIIEQGNNVRMVFTNYYTLGIDTPEELIIAQNILRTDNITKKYCDFS